jgi:hypothetical protein
MSEPSSPSDANRYEQACDQAIAMCDGNLRSTIKALIMANEYLEAELESAGGRRAGCAPASLPRPEKRRRLIGFKPGATPWPMSPITWHYRSQDDSGSPFAGAAGRTARVPRARCAARSGCRGRPAARRSRLQPHRRSR